MTEWLFDSILISLLIVLACAAMFNKSLFNAIILFIAFGLMLALCWARLGAADLALAEAAIGAGLTGVLLMAAYAQTPEPSDTSPRRSKPWLAWFFVPVVWLWLLLAVWPLIDLQSPLPALSADNLSISGVSHPTTAVLLNFRAWDTLLELAVLLLAFLGLRQLRHEAYVLPSGWPLLVAWTRILAPLIVVLGGYLLWRGTSAPGGAFQAGAVLAAGGVLLKLAGFFPVLRWQSVWLRGAVLLGVFVFLSVATLTAVFSDGWLAYPANLQTPLILLIELAATLSIAVTLIWLITGEESPQQ